MSPQCAKEHCPNLAPPLQKYCSRSCAPYGGLGGSSSPSGGRTRAFYTQAAGEKSAKSSPPESDSEEPSDPDPEESQDSEGGNPCIRSSARRSTLSAPLDRSETETENDSEPESGTIETKRSLSKKNMQDAVLDKLISNAPSKAFDEARSISVNLIDESVEQLRSLMLSSAPKGSKVTASDVNSACNCAKQIHNLIRLKLDILKESRK